MKIIKYLFFLILIALIAGAVYIATKDGTYQIEETKIISAPASVVFQEVNNLKSWEDWAPWLTESDAVITYSDTLSGEGASFSWMNEKDVNGMLKTIKLIPNYQVEQDLILDYGFAEAKSTSSWNFNEMEDGTQVVWRMEGKQSFKEKLQFHFDENSYSGMLRSRLQKGLENLNEVVLEKMDVHTINVDGLTTHGGGFYLYTTTSSNISGIQDKMQQMTADVSRFMETNNIPKLGDPFVLYNEWNEQNNTAIYSVGFFTPNLVITPAESTIVSGMMPVQQVVKTSLKGNYKYLSEAWDQAYAYIEANELQLAEGKAFEVYRTRPEDTANPANWLTEIYIPINLPEVVE